MCSKTENSSITFSNKCTQLRRYLLLITANETFRNTHNKTQYIMKQKITIYKLLRCFGIKRIIMHVYQNTCTAHINYQTQQNLTKEQRSTSTTIPKSSLVMVPHPGPIPTPENGQLHRNQN